MILLSFLGTNAYQRAAYTWVRPSGRKVSYTSRYATVAIAQFLKPKRLLLLATAEAQAAHADALRAELGDLTPLEIVDIPRGSSEDELWALFTTIAERVGHEEHLAMDVTHGFRSLPMVALLAVAFLRAARGVHVDHLLYGSWEAREEGDLPVTPIFDLTAMFALADWAVAADRFVRSGDSRDLAELVRTTKSGTDQDKKFDARKAGLLALALRDTSLALYLTQPLRAMKAADTMNLRLREMQGRYWQRAAPFVEILEQVRQTYLPLALAEPRAPGAHDKSLAIQREMVAWYLAHELYVQAATLAREWVISWLIAWRGGADLTERAAREAAENELGCLADASRRGQARYTLAGAPADVDLVALWQGLTDVRNAIAHSGMSRNDPKPQTLVDRLKELARMLHRLPLPATHENPDAEVER